MNLFLYTCLVEMAKKSIRSGKRQKNSVFIRETVYDKYHNERLERLSKRLHSQVISESDSQTSIITTFTKENPYNFLSRNSR